MTVSPYASGLGKTAANHRPLTPLSFLDRAAAVFPDRIAWIHGDRKTSYRDFSARCRRLASALAGAGVGRGDTVAVMAPNVPALLEAHYGVAMAGAVLNALNIRLDAAAIGFMLEHGEAKLLIADREFSPVNKDALAGMATPPIVVDYDDATFHGAGERLGEIEYEAFLDQGDAAFEPLAVQDEWDAISLSYTSGTTGNPKGVVYHHRGAFLNALGNQLVWAMPPPPAVIEAMEATGFRVTHVYGLTECYGPTVVSAWNEDWDDLPPDQRAALKARQGVRYPVLEALTVMDPDAMTETPADGETMGEVMMRGNVVMKGYLKNPTATAEAFAGDWFHTGDLGVMHRDGYIELKDRSKDIIISGGENISSIEIEGVLYRHRAVMEAAVVARPDEKWGETPCAFVELKPNQPPVSEADLIAFCQDNMARFKAPKTVVFGALPKTSTGKVQKYVLRETARKL